MAALVKSSQHKKLAREFLAFMVSEEFQAIIPTTNWMYPAALSADKLPAGFDQLIDPLPALLIDEKQVAKKRKIWVSEWLEVLSQ